MRTRAQVLRRTGGLLLAAGLATGLATGLAAGLAAAGAGQPAAAAESAESAEPADTHVIELTQIACQFLESENDVDRDFETAEKADCEAINAETDAARLADAQVLTLKPGRYVFRVTNLDVPYELGFWLREHDYNRLNPIDQLTKVSVSGGGLVTGATKDYEVELQPGEYLYSCPLNPTPDYKLVVAN